MNPPAWHQEHWRRLQGRRARGALPHAVLVCGQEGLGKRAFVERFVRGLLCAQARQGEACGQCRSCHLYAAGTHPDVIRLGLGQRKDGEQRKEIVVEQIRALSARLALASQFGGWQVSIIDPADLMNLAAANALLKTLEEPGQQNLLLLLADAPWLLPQTIRSRCQRIEFQLPTPQQSLAWLQSVGVAEAAAALAAAGGNPGLARRWAEQGALPRRQEVRRDLAALANGRQDALETVKRWRDDQPEQRVWFAAQAVAEEARSQAIGASPPLASRLDGDALYHWFDTANRTRELLRTPLRNDLLLLELLSQWARQDISACS